MTTGTRYLTRRALCDRLAISRAGSYRLEAAGFLPRGIRLGPGMVRWLVSEIEALERRAAEDRGAPLRFARGGRRVFQNRRERFGSGAHSISLESDRREGFAASLPPAGHETLSAHAVGRTPSGRRARVAPKALIALPLPRIGSDAGARVEAIAVRLEPPKDPCGGIEKAPRGQNEKARHREKSCDGGLLFGRGDRI